MPWLQQCTKQHQRYQMCPYTRKNIWINLFIVTFLNFRIEAYSAPPGSWMARELTEESGDLFTPFGALPLPAIGPLIVAFPLPFPLPFWKINTNHVWVNMSASGKYLQRCLEKEIKLITDWKYAKKKKKKIHLKSYRLDSRYNQVTNIILKK